MILPTSAQMARLAPSYVWREPDYKHERWKYDTGLLVPWEQLLLNKRKISSQQMGDGISITDISDYQGSTTGPNEIAQLIDAVQERGIVIRIAQGCRATIDLAKLIDEVTIQKIIIIAEAASQVTCSDKQTKSNQKITCTAVEIYAQEGALVDYHGEQALSDDVYEFRSFAIYADARSAVTVHSFATGARYAKTFMTAYLQGAGAQVMMEIGGLLNTVQQYSLVTEQHHQAPQTLSKCTVKYVQYHQTRTAYNGYITIEKNGIHTEAFQHHQALLIDDGARAAARPTLEVKTNDVQCGHGSAIGMLDEEQLWYLQSRGIEKTVAQKILVTAFLQNFSHRI